MICDKCQRVTNSLAYYETRYGLVLGLCPFCPSDPLVVSMLQDGFLQPHKPGVIKHDPERANYEW